VGGAEVAGKVSRIVASARDKARGTEALLLLLPRCFGIIDPDAWIAVESVFTAF
jgi:hypothetical protein